MTDKPISLGPIEKGDWIIQPSVSKNTILVMMFNYTNAAFCMQYLNNEYEANLFIEYIIEKGDYE